MLLNASGCLDPLTAPETARELDAFVTKTVTPLPRGGNAPVRIAETDVGMLNSIGLANPGRERFLAERRRYEERIRDLFREGVEGSELRTDLDVATAALLFLSAANWAYTWLTPGRDTDALADRFTAILVDGMRGYATPT